MKRYTAIFFLFLSICVLGQNIDIPKIIPPSPTAYELGRYGQVPVGMFTGTPNVSVPLYTYNTRNLSVPISLSYNSNGIKVDELSSNVGHGWSFNIGGVITRIVRDKPDEDRGVLTPDGDIQELGYRSEEAMEFFFAAGEEGSDSETDLYMYNFMGHSGKFVFDNKKESGVDRGIIMMPQTDVKVDVLSGGFKITTSDGVIFTFLEKERTKSITIGAGHQLPSFVDTAWYLTKIEHPKGDYIEFVYEEATSGFTYDASITESVKRMSPHIQQGCDGAIFGSSYAPETITTKVSIYSKRLIEIHSNSIEEGKVFIESNVSHPEIGSYKMVSKLTVKDKNSNVKEKVDLFYYPTTNNRILLDSLQFLTPDKNYSFEYYNPDDMPARLSKSVDYYGYYNGKNNAHRFPDPQDPFIKPYIHSALWDIPDGADKTVDPVKAQYGLLKKVNYPTKGSNEFEYESSSYYGEVSHYPNTVHLETQVLSDDMEMFVEDEFTTQQIGYNQEVNVIIYIGPTPCHDPNLPNAALITIKDNLNNTIYSETKQAGSYEYNFQFIEDRVYTLKIRTMRWCTQGNLNLYYNPGNIITTNENIPTGNLRIKRVKSFDTPTSLSPENITRYYYGKKETPNESSGQEGPRPYYVTKSMTRTGCAIAGTYSDIKYLSLNSNSMRQLYSSSDIGTTYYKYVTVSYGGDNFEGGGIENEYFIMPDVQGNPIQGDPIDGSPWVNTGWKNGLLKKETVFKKNGSDFSSVRETVNTYKQDPLLYKEVYGYSVIKKFDYVGGYINITYDCTPEDTSKRTKYWYCAADHKHSWLSTDIPGDGIDGPTCIAVGRNMQYQWINHPCYQKVLPYTIIRYDLIENLDIMAYSNNSYWFYQDTQTVTEYDESGNPKTVTTNQYYYDNPEHLQLTRMVTTRSGDDKTLITKTDYPDDMPGDPYMSDIDKDGQYRIAEPIRVQRLRKEGANPEELLSTKKTLYGSFGGLYLPNIIQVAKGTDPLESRLVYSEYDSYGNARELYQPNGARTSYIWGYHGKYPVAKIDNATYAQATDPGLNLDFGKINDPASAQEIQDEIAKIRMGLPNAQVTTYTYKELTGLNSVIDPRGYKTTYYYDTFGRLQYVKDMDGKILSENQYKYITD